jgi:hypothetical protein
MKLCKPVQVKMILLALYKLYLNSSLRKAQRNFKVPMVYSTIIQELLASLLNLYLLSLSISGVPAEFLKTGTICIMQG